MVSRSLVRLAVALSVVGVSLFVLCLVVDIGLPASVLAASVLLVRTIGILCLLLAIVISLAILVIR